MKFIKSDAELEQIHSVGEGLIYNDFSRKGPSGKKYNILHAVYCRWVLKSNVNVPKYFFSDIDEAIEWLRKNRGDEGKNWKRCGTCKAKARPISLVSRKSKPLATVESAALRTGVGVLLDDLEEFEYRFQSFKKIDYESYPYCFGEFWKWKLRTETKSEHILDAQHIKETYDRLSQTLKIWQWHRPDSFFELAERLKDALEKMRDAYNQIRSYSLLEFSEIPNEPLELVWHELGCVKTVGGKNPCGYYLVMATTKPLMFLWGQTLAFDSVVRRCMPRFSILELGDNYWSFGTWKKVMVRFQESLKRQPKALDLFKEVSRKEYGIESLVPYGQFLDLYYWVKRR